MPALPAPFVYEAPAACPSERDFRLRVAGWLDGTDETGDGLGAALASGRLQVGAHPLETGDRAFDGKASLPRSGAVRDLHAATCDELVTAFAFVFAVDVDERVLERAKPEPPAPRPERTAENSPPAESALQAPARPDVPRRLDLSAGLLSGVGGGALPHVAPAEGIELAAHLAREDDRGLVAAPTLRVGLGLDVPASTDTSAASATFETRFYTLQARLDACPLAVVEPSVALSLCARVETTLLFASGSGYSGSRSTTDVLFGLGGSARVAFPLSPRWSLGVDGGLVAPLERDRFTVLEGQGFVYATSPLTESVQAFVALRFR